MHVNEDNELSARLHRAGYQTFYDASVPVAYWSERSLSELLQRHYHFGRWLVLQEPTAGTGLLQRHVLHAIGALSGFAGLWMVTRRTPRRTRLTMMGIIYAGLAVVGGRSAINMRTGLELDESPPVRAAGVALAPALAAALSGAYAAGVTRARLTTRTAESGPPRIE
jgi:hypothetical protein